VERIGEDPSINTLVFLTKISPFSNVACDVKWTSFWVRFRALALLTLGQILILIAYIWRENMPGYLSKDTGFCSEKRTVPKSVARGKLPDMFAPNGGYCVYYPSSIFRSTHSFENWGYLVTWRVWNNRVRAIIFHGYLPNSLYVQIIQNLNFQSLFSFFIWNWRFQKVKKHKTALTPLHLNTMNSLTFYSFLWAKMHFKFKLPQASCSF